MYFVAEGHCVLYDREAPFELRIQDPNSGPQEVGTLEAIRVKILNLVSSMNECVFRDKPVFTDSVNIELDKAATSEWFFLLILYFPFHSNN